MPRFVVQIGPQRVKLDPGVLRVGRDPLCEIQLADESVSRRHAILRVGDVVQITDDASRNGVRVNGIKIRGLHELLPGDRISLGAVDMLFEVEADDDVFEGRFSTGPTRPVPRPNELLDPLAILSPREREVMARLARGEAHRSIAEELDVSVKTVETYRARIGEKLGLKSRADLVRVALEAGLLAR